MKTNGVDYVICAAGEGLRLRSPDLRMPKPLIHLNGLSFLERSLESLEFCSGDRLIIITQKYFGAADSMRTVLNKKYPQLQIIWQEIDHRTSGQLETAMLSQDHLRDQGVVIFNSDTYFKSFSLIEKLKHPDVDGIIPCSMEMGNEWSFCRTEEESDLIIEVAEKKRISNLASVGYYYFKNASLFLRYAEKELIDCKLAQRESYVAPLYNRMIKDRYRIHVDHVEEFKPMGTPLQLQNYWNMTLDDLAHENNQILKVSNS